MKRQRKSKREKAKAKEKLRKNLYPMKTSHEHRETITISLTTFSNAFQNTEPHAGTVEKFSKSTRVDKVWSGQGRVVLETMETMSTGCCVFVFPNRLCWFLAQGLGGDEVRVKIIAVNGRHDEYSKSSKGQPNKEILVTGHRFSFCKLNTELFLMK